MDLQVNTSVDTGQWRPFTSEAFPPPEHWRQRCSPSGAALERMIPIIKTVELATHNVSHSSGSSLVSRLVFLRCWRNHLTSTEVATGLIVSFLFKKESLYDRRIFLFSRFSSLLNFVLYWIKALRWVFPATCLLNIGAFIILLNNQMNPWNGGNKTQMGRLRLSRSQVYSS